MILTKVACQVCNALCLYSVTYSQLGHLNLLKEIQVLVGREVVAHLISMLLHV